MKKVDFKNVPEWAIYALEYGVNEDPSLIDEDRILINEFIETNFPKGYSMEVDWDSYESFNIHPLFGKSCGTYNVSFFI